MWISDLIPIQSVSQGSWIVKQSVGKKACLVGQALEINYFHGKNYLEVSYERAYLWAIGLSILFTFFDIVRMLEALLGLGMANDMISNVTSLNYSQEHVIDIIRNTPYISSNSSCLR